MSNQLPVDWDELTPAEQEAVAARRERKRRIKAHQDAVDNTLSDTLGTNKLVFVHVDDWVGLYRDGELLYQGHDIEPERLLELIGIDYVSVSDADHLLGKGDSNRNGNLPQNLSSAL